MPSPSSDAVLDYDYLIVGGGAAGLSLAYHITQEPRLAGKKVLLLEPEPKDQNDRHWSFWTDEPSLFEAIAVRTWTQAAFRAPGFERVFDLAPYRYLTIRGLDFYRFVQEELARHPCFTRRLEAVESLENQPHGAVARTATGTYKACYAFDSRPPQVVPQPEKFRYLLQHFVGWEVETDHDVFDPNVVEFMDFRGAQVREPRFIYVLPYTPRRALVEYTLFSGELLPKAEYEAALHDYLHQTLGVKNYRILEQEVGAIPMTDHPLPARVGEHIVNLGTRAGRAKPSTGYAFVRIQAQSKRLVAALAATGHPPADATGDQWQFGLFDTLLLDIMQRRGESVRDIFRQMFERNPVQRILRFLDEKTTWPENLQVMYSVQPWPFLRSIGNVLRGRPGRR